MVLWDSSPPSSRSTGFLNKVAIYCPNNSSLDLLACRAASSTSLDWVRVTNPFVSSWFLSICFFFFFLKNSIFKKNLFILFIYFWLHWVFVAVCRPSLVAASRGYSSLLCTGFSLQWLLLLRSTGSRHAGFSSL